MFDNGPGSVAVVYAPSDSSALCDGQWHYVRAEKSGVTGTLQVDQNPPVSQSSSATSFMAVNTNDPLFIGGVPGGWSLSLIPRLHAWVESQSHSQIACLGGVSVSFPDCMLGWGLSLIPRLHAWVGSQSHSQIADWMDKILAQSVASILIYTCQNL